MKDTPDDDPQEEIPDFRDNVDAIIKEYEALVEANNQKWLHNGLLTFDETFMREADELEETLEMYKGLRASMLPPRARKRSGGD
jgi:hypothetical protein